jgi:hypothetical protein
MLTNLAAAAKLPFIYFGIAKDIWLQFDRYVEIEKGNPSTFFVLPFEGDPWTILGRSSALGPGLALRCLSHRE